MSLITHPTAPGHTLTLSGDASISVYQQALSSVTYSNQADEPTYDVIREVVFSVYDGAQYSNEVRGQISITLVDDQPLILMCGVGMATFIEGSALPVELSPSLNLMDGDEDHVIVLANISVSNPQTGDSIQVTSSLTGSLEVISNGQEIFISGDGSAAQYEVRVYHNYYSVIVVFST